MKNKKYIISVNEGVYFEKDKNVFSREEVEEIFKKWSEGEKLEDEEGEEVSIDMLIDVGGCGDKVNVCNKCMCEYGDDYVSVSVVELSEI